MAQSKAISADALVGVAHLAARSTLYAHGLLNHPRLLPNLPPLNQVRPRHSHTPQQPHSRSQLPPLKAKGSESDLRKLACSFHYTICARATITGGQHHVPASSRHHIRDFVVISRNLYTDTQCAQAHECKIRLSKCRVDAAQISVSSALQECTDMRNWEQRLQCQEWSKGRALKDVAFWRRWTHSQ